MTWELWGNLLLVFTLFFVGGTVAEFVCTYLELRSPRHKKLTKQSKKLNARELDKLLPPK